MYATTVCYQKFREINTFITKSQFIPNMNCFHVFFSNSIDNISKNFVKSSHLVIDYGLYPNFFLSKIPWNQHILLYNPGPNSQYELFCPKFRENFLAALTMFHRFGSVCFRNWFQANPLDFDYESNFNQ